MSFPSGYSADNPPQSTAVPGPSEEQQNKKAYLNDLQSVIRDKEAKKKAEREERIRKEREEMNRYKDPFGKAGAGAPVRDRQGNSVVTRMPPDEQQF